MQQKWTHHITSSGILLVKCWRNLYSSNRKNKEPIYLTYNYLTKKFIFVFWLLNSWTIFLTVETLISDPYGTRPKSEHKKRSAYQGSKKTPFKTSTILILVKNKLIQQTWRLTQLSKQAVAYKLSSFAVIAVQAHWPQHAQSGKLRAKNAFSSDRVYRRLLQFNLSTLAVACAERRIPGWECR